LEQKSNIYSFKTSVKLTNLFKTYRTATASTSAGMVSKATETKSCPPSLLDVLFSTPREIKLSPTKLEIPKIDLLGIMAV